MTSLAGVLKNRGKQAAKRLLRYDSRNWLRIRQIEAFTVFLEAANRKSRDVIEISPGWNRYWRALCPDYRSVDFPDFDICKDRTDGQYSIVIADPLLRQPDRKADQARRPQVDTGTGDSHQNLHRSRQHRSQALQMDQVRR